MLKLFILSVLALAPASALNVKRRLTTEAPFKIDDLEYNSNISQKNDAGFKTYYNFGDSSLSAGGAPKLRSTTPKTSFKTYTDFNLGKTDTNIESASDKLSGDNDYSQYKLKNHKTAGAAAPKADFSLSNYDFGSNFKPKNPRFGADLHTKPLTTKFTVNHPIPAISPKYQLDADDDAEDEDDEPEYTPKYRPKKISDYKGQGGIKKPQLITFDESDFEDYKPSAFAGSPVDDSNLKDSFKTSFSSYGGSQNSFSSPADYDSSKGYDSSEFDSQSFGNLGTKFGPPASSGSKFNFENFNNKPKFPAKTQSFGPKFNFESNPAPKYNFDAPGFDFDSGSASKFKPENPKFASDFELKNIKLPQKFNSQKYDPFSVSNPNPLEFKPQFKLQDVPNLYPQDGAGYGTAGRGQLENYFAAEQQAKDELIKQQLKNNPDPAAKGQYQQFLKAQEDEQIEQQQFREQLQFQQQQQQQQHQQQHLGFKNQRPGLQIPQNKYRPVRKIPGRPISLGLRHFGTGVPSLIDRPYSITFNV